MVNNWDARDAWSNALQLRSCKYYEPFSSFIHFMVAHTHTIADNFRIKTSIAWQWQTSTLVHTCITQANAMYILRYMSLLKIN